MTAFHDEVPCRTRTRRHFWCRKHDWLLQKLVGPPLTWPWQSPLLLKISLSDDRWLSQEPEQTVSAGTHTFETSGPSWWWARASSYSGFFAPYASQLGNHFPLWTLNTVVCVKTRYLFPLWAFPETASKIEETQSYLHPQDLPLVRLISTFLLFRERDIS